jgi:hypothetical protein
VALLGCGLLGTAAAGAAAFLMLVMVTTAAAFTLFMLVVMAAAAALAFFMIVVMTAAAAFALFMLMVMAAAAAPALFLFVIVVVTAAAASTLLFLVVMVMTATAAAAFIVVIVMVVMAAAATPAAAGIHNDRGEGFSDFGIGEADLLQRKPQVFVRRDTETILSLRHAVAAHQKSGTRLLHQIHIARDMEHDFRRRAHRVELPMIIHQDVIDLKRTQFINRNRHFVRFAARLKGGGKLSAEGANQGDLLHSREENRSGLRSRRKDFGERGHCVISRQYGLFDAGKYTDSVRGR